MADSKLTEYIAVSATQGKTKEDIYKTLLAEGWTVDAIQDGYKTQNAVKEKEDTSKKTIRLIVTIGAVLIGAGIFSFVAANWQEMARAVKVGVILVSMLVSYIAGWYMKEKYQMAKTGEALILLGSIIYGAGIFLVAQMFNIRANWPDGFILWMIGVVAMAYAVESFSLYYLAIPLGVAAVFGHPFDIFNSFGYSPFLLTSSLLLLVATVITFLTGWTIRKKVQSVHSKEDIVREHFFLLSFLFFGITLLAFNKDLGDPFTWRTILFVTSLVGLLGAYTLNIGHTLVLSLLGMATWWGVQAAEWTSGKHIKPGAVFAGVSFIAILFYMLGHIHEKQAKFKNFAMVYLALGIMAVTGTLFVLSTNFGIGAIQEMTKGAFILASWQLTLSLLILLCAVVGTAIFALSQKLISVFEFLAAAALLCLFGVVALLPEQSIFAQGHYGIFSGRSSLSDTGVVWALVYNLAIFLELLGLLFSGYVRRESWLINIGALLLFLLIIVKYFDWFFTFLDKSIFFIGAGILLFVVGWFMERGRKYMLANIK